MLESEFKRQRAKLVRELADQTTDPFIRKRLLALASRYDDGVPPRTPIALAELEMKGRRYPVGASDVPPAKHRKPL